MAQVLLEGGDFAPAAASAPAVACDGKYFYLAAVQRDASTGSGAGDPLLGWNAVPYRSADGVGWEFMTTIPMDVDNTTKLAIAAKSNGSLLGAC